MERDPTVLGGRGRGAGSGLTVRAECQTRGVARRGASTHCGGRRRRSLLLCIAALVLLFTGRYPRPLYDFVMGMDRWALRVAAYTALMSDQYPPFRLDTGGPDPGSLPARPSPPPPAGTPVAGPYPPAPREGARSDSAHSTASAAGSGVHPET